MSDCIFQRELNSLSMVGGRLFQQNWEFERLDVDASVALNMFEDNRSVFTNVQPFLFFAIHNSVLCISPFSLLNEKKEAQENLTLT